jgi:5S rRNA maturation endonuclease (ribonuclease M5)
MNLEINFFIIQTDMDFKSDEIKNSLKEIINQIFLDNFLENENFKFYLTKKIKSEVESVQIENV